MQKRVTIFFGLMFSLSLLLNTSTAFSQIRFSDGFETIKVGSPPKDNPWKQCSGNCPLATDKYARSGKQSLHSYLNRETSKNPYRTEVVVRPVAALPMGTEAWYGISIFIPKDHPGLKGAVVQFANNKEKELGENKGNTGIVPGGLGYQDDGKWHLFNQSVSDRVTSKDSERKLTNWTFPAEKGKWTDWVFYYKWSWKNDGIMKVWINGKQVVDKKGPNCYNDALAPKMKFGTYNRKWDPNTYIKKYGLKDPHIVDVSVYFDDIKVITGSNGSYKDVAPGGKPPQVDELPAESPNAPKKLKVN